MTRARRKDRWPDSILGRCRATGLLTRGGTGSLSALTRAVLLGYLATGSRLPRRTFLTVRSLSKSARLKPKK